jgi:hypothetical protein
LIGREGFGFLSPSRRAYEAGFSTFREIKRLFFTAPDVKKRRRTEVTEVTGHSLSVTGRVRSVSAVNMAWNSFSEKLTGRGGESGHSRSDASGRGGCLRDSNRTSGVTRPVCSAARPISVQCLHAFGHDQPDVSDHAWRLTGNDRTLALWRPIRLAARPVADSLERCSA